MAPKYLTYHTPPKNAPADNLLGKPGLIERGVGRIYMLARCYYELVGRNRAYPREKGLD
jgi:hypothetical protein